MLAVVLTGPPGAGKSTVATAVHDRLADADVANALIEVDELGRCYPPLGAAQLLENLATICAAYRATGYDLLILTATVENDAHGKRLLAAVGVTAHLLVRLVAEPATLARRIRAREPADWSGMDNLLAAAARLATHMPSLRGVGLVLDTEGQAPGALAAQVIAAIKDRAPSR